jgi:predicted kinase
VLSVLVQLSGVPGSGKSTLARGLSEALGLVVLDTDVVKSALLSRDLGVHAAGPASYGVVLALAADLLAQGHQVVIDSPCRYPALLKSGQEVAEAEQLVRPQDGYVRLDAALPPDELLHAALTGLEPNPPTR